MRDRLIELISQVQYMGGLEGKLADRLLAAGVIVPPCKVGDAVYYINTRPHIELYRDKVYEAVVSRIVTNSLGVSLVILIKTDEWVCEVPSIYDFGKTVFLTREEAEKALAERSGSDG